MASGDILPRENRLRIFLDSIALIVSLVCVSLTGALAIGGTCMTAIITMGSP